MSNIEKNKLIKTLLINWLKINKNINNNSSIEREYKLLNSFQPLHSGIENSTISTFFAELDNIYLFSFLEHIDYHNYLSPRTNGEKFNTIDNLIKNYSIDLEENVEDNREIFTNEKMFVKIVKYLINYTDINKSFCF